MYQLADYDYPLPEALIAQNPGSRRETSRLLHLDRMTGGIRHKTFTDIVGCLRPSDILVVNDTEVIPGRLLGKKDTGGKVEVLILDYAFSPHNHDNESRTSLKCLIKCAKRPKPGTILEFEAGLVGRVTGSQNGYYLVAFDGPEAFEKTLYKIGKVPLPPYIRRQASADDIRAYQTVYASKKGAIAAPTAGLHFSESLLAQLREIGVTVAAITLHVGYGTFMPVRASDIRNHRMHSERYEISRETAERIAEAKRDGRRIVAVGTTCVRTLEHVFARNGHPPVLEGTCDLFIYPGYRFRMVDAMITNFHLPQSTLIILVSAFAGRETVLRAYRVAVEQGYRFFSYGDAMFIE
jgi:S-adenosylmethionine:tRNA ribosyltransferase-isomerase